MYFFALNREPAYVQSHTVLFVLRRIQGSCVEVVLLLLGLEGRRYRIICFPGEPVLLSCISFQDIFVLHVDRPCSSNGYHQSV